jgi:hypothetical protein
LRDIEAARCTSCWTREPHLIKRQARSARWRKKCGNGKGAVLDCGAHTTRRAALLSSLSSARYLTDEPTVDAASAERQCCNLVKECRGIAPASDCLSDGGIKCEPRPAERSTHDANLAKRRWRWARPECAAHLSGDAFGCLLRNSDANTASGTTNIYTSCKVHQPCANHRRHPIVGPRDNRDASRQTKITRC